MLLDRDENVLSEFLPPFKSHILNPLRVNGKLLMFMPFWCKQFHHHAKTASFCSQIFGRLHAMNTCHKKMQHTNRRSKKACKFLWQLLLHRVSSFQIPAHMWFLTTLGHIKRVLFAFLANSLCENYACFSLWLRKRWPGCFECCMSAAANDHSHFTRLSPCQSAPTTCRESAGWRCFHSLSHDQIRPALSSQQ